MKVLIKVLRKYCCAIVIIALACGCSRIDSETTVTTETTATTETTGIKYYRRDMAGNIYTIAIEGHIYIVMTNAPSGCIIIHAEHCPCKNSRE